MDKLKRCLQCGAVLTGFSTKFCSRSCALRWRNLNDPIFREKRVKALKEKVSKEIPKEVLEELYFKEQLTQKEIAEKLGVSLATVKKRMKLYHFKGRRKLLEKQKELISKANLIWDESKIKMEFDQIVNKLGRVPMSSELTEINEGLRHAIFRRFGTYSGFLEKFNYPPPTPILGEKRRKNFKFLASKCAIKYYQNGKWSSSELKIKKILEELGLLENLDFWHNFPVLSPLKGKYELDFYLPKWNLAIECDSFWHSIGESPERDKLRDDWLKQHLNVDTLRFRQFSSKHLSEIKEIIKNELFKRKIESEIKRELAGEVSYEVI